MPWAMSAPTVASPVVIRAAASACGFLDCLGLAIRVAFREGGGGPECGRWEAFCRARRVLEPLAGGLRLRSERQQRTRKGNSHDREVVHRCWSRRARRGLDRLDRLRQDERLADRQQWFDHSAG